MCMGLFPHNAKPYVSFSRTSGPVTPQNTWWQDPPIMHISFLHCDMHGNVFVGPQKYDTFVYHQSSLVKPGYKPAPCDCPVAVEQLLSRSTNGASPHP